MQSLTWIEFILTLEKAFGVRRGLTRSATGAGPSQVPFLERTLSNGRIVSVSLNVNGNTAVPPSMKRHILARLYIDEIEFEQL